MAVPLNCPRCKKSLLVPGEKAGTYAHCPHCNGRLWVPENPSAASTPPTPAKPWDAAPGRKTARFISAEAAQSTLKIAEDGQLPELQLQEGRKKEKADAETATVNPLVLFGVIALSVVLSIFLVLYDPGSEDAAARQKKQQARERIELEFFADQAHYVDPENAPPLKLYQRLLREAQRAYRRGDHASQRNMYRKVMDLLRAEQGTAAAGTDRFGRGKFKGVTGSPERDDDLKDLLSTLLNED